MDRRTQNTESGSTLVNEKLTFLRYDKIGGRASRAARFLSTRFAWLTSSVQKSGLSARFLNTHFVRTCFLHNRFLNDSIKIFQKSGLRAARFLEANIQKLRLRAANCGSILIEFAICMPVLIILLFYIHDLMKIKRLYSQTEFVAQQMANILQNLAKKRAAEGKTLGVNDLSHAASLAYLTIYPGTTMYSTTSGQIKHEFIHFPFFVIYYVQGTTGGKAKCLWGKAMQANTRIAPPFNTHMNITSNQGWSTVTYNSNEVAASSIYPTLRVEENKPKIILETTLRWGPNYADKNGNKVSNARQAFGLHLANPKHLLELYFHSVVIFSPNDGFPKARPDS